MKKFILALIAMGLLVALCMGVVKVMEEEYEKECISLDEAVKGATELWKKGAERHRGK